MCHTSRIWNQVNWEIKFIFLFSLFFYVFVHTHHFWLENWETAWLWVMPMMLPAVNVILRPIGLWLASRINYAINQSLSSSLPLIYLEQTLFRLHPFLGIPTKCPISVRKKGFSNIIGRLGSLVAHLSVSLLSQKNALDFWCFTIWCFGLMVFWYFLAFWYFGTIVVF